MGRPRHPQSPLGAHTKGTADQLAHAAINAATNLANRTPAVIGLHWATIRPVEARSGDYDRCQVPGHQQWPAWHCAGCRADATPTDQPTRAGNPREHVERGSGPDLVRAAMRIHGVPTTDELRTRRAAEQQNLTEPGPVTEPMEEA